ncbi:MAG: hypothetical protein JNN02_07290 [Tabrizicola sp.]|nr:hypothetical protein [Tabrizicola sp.]
MIVSLYGLGFARFCLQLTREAGNPEPQAELCRTDRGRLRVPAQNQEETLSWNMIANQMAESRRIGRHPSCGDWSEIGESCSDTWKLFPFRADSGALWKKLPHFCRQLCLNLRLRSCLPAGIWGL